MDTLTEARPASSAKQRSVAPGDERIVADAQRRLRERDFRFTRCISCEYREGVLLLWGTVPSYYLKQLAQVSVRDCSGVEKIDNRIAVFPG